MITLGDSKKIKTFIPATWNSRVWLIADNGCDQSESSKLLLLRTFREHTLSVDVCWAIAWETVAQNFMPWHLRQHTEKKVSCWRILSSSEIWLRIVCRWVLRFSRNLPSPSPSSILKIEVPESSGTLGLIYQTTRRHIHEDCNLHRHHRENPKFLTDTWRMYGFTWRWRKQFSSKNLCLFTELHGVTPRRQ